MKKKLTRRLRDGAIALCAIVIAIAGFASCTSIPKGAKAVDTFDLHRYLGLWHEIARFDFTFEKNLNQTTAEYSLNADGTVRVKNSGFDYVSGKWKSSVGKARFRGASDRGELEVSFFGPFYAGYNVIALDPEYRYALIAGSSLEYLWILSRDKTMPDQVRTDYLSIATRLGYDTSKLIWVAQE